MAASLGNAVGFAGGYSKWREGRKMQRQAQSDIENFEWNELRNPYKDLSVSTLGADLQREEAARAAASALTSLSTAGTRALGVGAGRVIQNNNNINRQVAADLDQQQKEINFAAAQDDTQIRAMEERRQADELQGYGQKYNVGMNMKYGGVSDMYNTIQAQGKEMDKIKSQVMGAVTGGMGGMGGGMMGGMTGQSPQQAVTVPYGTGMPNTGGYNDQAAYYAQGYGVSA